MTKDIYFTCEPEFYDGFILDDIELTETISDITGKSLINGSFAQVSRSQLVLILKDAKERLPLNKGSQLKKRILSLTEILDNHNDDYFLVYAL